MLEYRSFEDTYSDRFDMAMLVVNRTENATSVICSLRLNLDSLKYPSFNITNVPSALNDV